MGLTKEIRVPNAVGHHIVHLWNVNTILANETLQFN